MLAGANAICSQCHDKGSPGANAAAEMAGLINKLDSSLDRSDEILKRASRSGMEVSEAVAEQLEGRENLIKAKVAVHAFDVAAVRKPAEAGLAIGAKTLAAGEEALKERDFRRAGLGISLFLIALTIAGLRLKLRDVERVKPDQPSEGPRS
jgi:hypothetical protein